MNVMTIFNSLVGAWRFNRTINSRRDDAQSGTVSGRAVFQTIGPHELHYQETGVFKTQQHQTFNIQREYIYRYEPDEDCIQTYFVENNHAGNLFCSLAFMDDKPSSDLLATAEHRCIQDNYRATYRFIDGESFDAFELIYDVSGPAKDYTSTTHYKRDSDGIQITP